MTAVPQNQQLTIARTFDAPMQVVFAAWTVPAQVAGWWGPDGFHAPPETVEIDLRVGGGYHLVMVQDETGARFPLHYEIVELVVPELLVLKGEPVPEMGMHAPTMTRIELQKDGPKTRLTLTDGPYPATGHAERGWRASFDKLEAALGSA
jgi:uncharacterized protein YndB with AHSA1/START domain